MHNSLDSLGPKEFSCIVPLGGDRVVSKGIFEKCPIGTWYLTPIGLIPIPDDPKPGRSLQILTAGVLSGEAVLAPFKVMRALDLRDALGIKPGQVFMELNRLEWTIAYYCKTSQLYEEYDLCRHWDGDECCASGSC